MKTLFDKIWDKHVIHGERGEAQLIYIDLQLIHEVTSAQAFDGLRMAKRGVRRANAVFGTMDHCTPTTKEERIEIKDPVAKEQLETLEKNCKEFGIELASMNDTRNGIVHIVGPEQGLTQPGKTIVCGDSHTATHGAFGAIAFGIGTSEVEHVLATQTLWQKKPKTFGIEIEGKLKKGVTAKDIILYIIKMYGVTMGTGYALEFFGETVTEMSMDERMTLCNMAIEAGAKSGIIAPDDTTYEYLEGRPYTPKGEDFKKSMQKWKELFTDSIEAFDKYIKINISNLKPQITWGTNPSMGVDINEKLPEIKDENMKKAYDYMGLNPGMKTNEIPLKHVFIGSCTNGRISDLQEAAKIVKGNKVAKNIIAVVVPGSNEVKRLAEKEGLDKIFIDAGFQWREPGCSTCLGMNPDLIPAYDHVASTSNRNFEGRQGKNARTHLVSPITAALAAIKGRFEELEEENNEEIY